MKVDKLLLTIALLMLVLHLVVAPAIQADNVNHNVAPTTNIVSGSQGATFAYIADSVSIAVYDMATITRVATIPMGGGCAACSASSVNGIAVKLDGTKVYVANGDTDSVSVIDTLSNGVVATIAVGHYPNGIAVNSAGTRVYVANASSNTVSVIDTGNNTVIATVPAGSYPEDVVVNASGSRVYVVNSQSKNVSVIDTSTNSVVATVTVGNVDNWVFNKIAITPNDQRVYVTNSVAKSVSIIDTSCNCISKTLTLSSSPWGIAINPAGTRVYITKSYGISIFDTVTDTNLANVSFTSYSQGIAFNADGSKAYVSTQNSNTLAVLDTVSNSVITSVAVNGYIRFGHFVAKVPSPASQVINFNPLLNQSLGSAPFVISAQASSGLAVTFSSTTPSTCSVNGNSVSLIETGTCTIEASQVGNAIYAPANSIQQSFNISTGTASQTATYAYLGDYNSSAAYVFDMAGGGLIKTLTVGTGSESRLIGFAARTDGKKVYVTNAYDNTVSVIDTATQTIVATLPTGSYPQGIALNVTGTQAYVANSGSSNVTVLNLLNGTVIATIPIVSGYPVGVAVTADGTKAYVTSHYSNIVSVIDTGSNTVIDTISVGPYPVGVAVNPAGTRVYVANAGPRRGPGSVSVIDTASNTVVATVPIDSDVYYGVTVDPTGTWVYVTNSAGMVTVLDAATNSISYNVSVGGGFPPDGIALSPDGTRAYASTGNRVVAFDTASNSITAIATVPWGTDGAFGQFIAQVPCPCDQIISFGALPTQVYGAPPYTLNAQTSSALPVVFTSNTPLVCTVSGNTVNLVATGTCAIQASQPGNAAYRPAASVTQSFNIMLTLTVSNAKIAFGTVYGNSGGIVCGTTCSDNFFGGSLVKLTAIPVSGYQFTGWGGACSGYGNSCTVTMNAAQTVTANFAPFKVHQSAWKRAISSIIQRGN